MIHNAIIERHQRALAAGPHPALAAYESDKNTRVSPWRHVLQWHYDIAARDRGSSFLSSRIWARLTKQSEKTAKKQINENHRIGILELVSQQFDVAGRRFCRVFRPVQYKPENVTPKDEAAKKTKAVPVRHFLVEVGFAKDLASLSSAHPIPKSMRYAATYAMGHGEFLRQRKGKAAATRYWRQLKSLFTPTAAPKAEETPTAKAEAEQIAAEKFWNRRTWLIHGLGIANLVPRAVRDRMSVSSVAALKGDVVQNMGFAAIVEGVFSDAYAAMLRQMAA